MRNEDIESMKFELNRFIEWIRDKSPDTINLTLKSRKGIYIGYTYEINGSVKVEQKI